jgi:hypothetical protein
MILSGGPHSCWGRGLKTHPQSGSVFCCALKERLTNPLSDLKSDPALKNKKNFVGCEKCTQIEMSDSNFQTATSEKWVAGTSPR